MLPPKEEVQEVLLFTEILFNKVCDVLEIESEKTRKKGEKRQKKQKKKKKKKKKKEKKKKKGRDRKSVV